MLWLWIAGSTGLKHSENGNEKDTLSNEQGGGVQSPACFAKRLRSQQPQPIDASSITSWPGGHLYVARGHGIRPRSPLRHNFTTGFCAARNHCSFGGGLARSSHAAGVVSHRRRRLGWGFRGGVGGASIRTVSAGAQQCQQECFCVQHRHERGAKRRAGLAFCDGKRAAITGRKPKRSTSVRHGVE